MMQKLDEALIFTTKFVFKGEKWTCDDNQASCEAMSYHGKIEKNYRMS